MKIFKILTLLFMTIVIIYGQKKSITDTYYYHVDDYRQLEVDISYGFGKLVIKPNPQPDKALIANVTYTPSYVLPELDFYGDGSTGHFIMDIENFNFGHDSGINISIGRLKKNIDPEKNVNDMDLLLSKDIPTSLNLDFGMGETLIDLTDIMVKEFIMDCGLSDVEILISNPNQTRCETLEIENGLGAFQAKYLGNLRAEEIELNIGLGSAKVDLTGENLVDSEISIEVGLGSLELILPEDANIKIDIEQSFLSSVTVTGLIRENEDEYVSRNWVPGRVKLVLNVGVGLGSVNIYLR